MPARTPQQNCQHRAVNPKEDSSAAAPRQLKSAMIGSGILTLFPNRLMKSAILSPSQSQQTPIREIDMAKVKLIAAV